MTEPADMNRGMLEKVTGWMTGQPAYIVLLTLVLGAVGYGALYGLPQIVTQIQKGYDAMDLRHSEQIEKADLRHAIERKELRDDSKADRVEFRSTVEKVGTAIEKLSDKIDGRK